MILFIVELFANVKNISLFTSNLHHRISIYDVESSESFFFIISHSFFFFFSFFLKIYLKKKRLNMIQKIEHNIFKCPDHGLM